jgi:putative Holliday junction resolvase
MRILAIDPGEKHIGLAISDPTATIAAPLTVLQHVSRPIDAAAIAELATQLPLTTWDESFSTQAARQARIGMGVSRRKRKGHLDELAATVILQSFLDARLDR